MDKNMILHLPFDDPDGSIAYDFSQYRNDATLSEGADFSKKSKVGKSLALNGTGECETARSIPFSGDFTLCFWVLPVSQKLGWVLNMPGIDNYKEQWLDVMPDVWIFFAFVKSGTFGNKYPKLLEVLSVYEIFHIRIFLQLEYFTGFFRHVKQFHFVQQGFRPK